MNYRELADRLRAMQPQRDFFTSGKVLKVDGLTCVVAVGNGELEANLRPTSLAQDGEILIVPKVGSAVVMGCLAGDYSQMIVLAMDAAERVVINGEVMINGGSNGGLVNVAALTDKLNELVESFNQHTHTGNMGSPTSPPSILATSFKKDDYEDSNVKH